MKILTLILMFFSVNTLAITYKYNNTNKLEQVTYDNGTVISYEYDADGNITEVSPTESTYNEGDSGNGTDSGDTSSTNNGTPDTAEPVEKESGGGALGLFTLMFTSGLIAIRSCFKVKLNRG